MRTSTRLRMAATALALTAALIGSGLIADQSQAKEGEGPAGGPVDGDDGGYAELAGPARADQLSDHEGGLRRQPHDHSHSRLAGPDSAGMQLRVPLTVTKPPVRMNKPVPVYFEG